MKRVIVLAIALLFTIAPLQRKGGSGFGAMVDILLIGASDAYSQTDTMQYRFLVSKLHDSTQFEYYLGGYRLKQPYDFKYIGFGTDSSLIHTARWLESDTFFCHGNLDTLMVGRQVEFDDNLTPLLDTIMSITDTVLRDSIAAAWEIASESKQVTPLASQFDNTSFLKYILQIKRASDSSVIAGLDTATCFADSLGRLRYRTNGNTPNQLRFALPFSASGTYVFLDVKLVSVIPLGSFGLTHNGATLPGSSWPSDNIIECGMRQVGCDSDWEWGAGYPPAYKTSIKTSESIGAQPPVGMSLTVSPHPNPAQASVTFNVRAENAGLIQLTLVDILGDRVYSDVRKIVGGQNSIVVDLPNCRSGKYFVRLTDGHDVLTTSVLITH